MVKEHDRIRDEWQAVARGWRRWEPLFQSFTWPVALRMAAVAQIGPIQFTGFLGWMAWLVVHLYYLIGFENRLRVILRWSWYYLRLDRPVRAIIEYPGQPGLSPPGMATGTPGL